MLNYLMNPKEGMANIVQNIWCVGRNFREHASELKNLVPEQPLIFLKAGSTLVKSGELIHLPSWAGQIHHEVELAVFLDKNLQVFEGAVALDLTARDLQTNLKKQGHPWTLAKSFKNSCPIGERFLISDLDLLQREGELRLFVNGEQRQMGNLQDMVFSICELVGYIKERFPVCPGDIILTGTPAGVAAIHSGDCLRAELSGKSLGVWQVV